MTLCGNAERPETIDLGTDPQAILPAMEKLFSGTWKQGQKIPKWDGQAAERIVDVLVEMR